MKKWHTRLDNKVKDDGVVAESAKLRNCQSSHDIYGLKKRVAG